MREEIYLWEKLLDAVGVDPTAPKVAADPILATAEALRRIAVLKHIVIEYAQSGECYCDEDTGHNYCDHHIAVRIVKVLGEWSKEDEDVFCDGMNNLP